MMRRWRLVSLAALLVLLGSATLSRGTTIITRGVNALVAPITINSAVADPGYALTIISNGGGRGMLIQNNSVAPTAYGLVILTASTAAPPTAATPALSVTSTGYYSGLFINVTDRGVSDADNASLIPLVTNGLQANSLYVEQGPLTLTLARTNSYPNLYVTRTAALGGFDFTGAMIKVDDVTAATGDLFQAQKQTVLKTRLTGAGRLGLRADGIAVTAPAYTLDVTGASGAVAVLRGRGGAASNGSQLRWAGQKDGELFAVGTDVSTSTGLQTFEIYNLVSGQPSLTITAADEVTFAAKTFATLGTPANGTMTFCSDCDPALTMAVCVSAGAKTGAFAFRINGAWICGG